MRPARLALLCLLLAACSDGLADVARATTPAEERAAFAALIKRSGVRFTAHDATGKQLDLGAPRWWDQARTIRLGTRDGHDTIEHRLISPENVLVLMQE